MRQLIRVVSVCLFLAAAPSSAEGVGIKAGGGLILDPSRWGGHVSFEIPIGGDYPLSVAPFFELYEKDGEKGMPTGVSLLYEAPLSEQGGNIYFGAGLGFLLRRGSVLGQSNLTDSSNDLMMTAAGGFSFGVTEQVGIFAQTRWFVSLVDEAQSPFDLEYGTASSKNEITLIVGLNFQIGE